jgi:hypothetical protein
LETSAPETSPAEAVESPCFDAAASRYLTNLQRHRQEAIMKYTAVAVLALLALSSAAWAQNSANHFPAPPPNIAPYADTFEFQQGTTRLRQSANDCAPDESRAVWGSQGALLGYSCYNNPNGN